MGDWQFYIKNVHTETQGISVTATSRPASYNVAPVTAAAHMNRANTAFNPVVVYAEVSQGFWPVLGATVTATIEKDDATAVTLELLDNGAGKIPYIIVKTLAVMHFGIQVYKFPSDLSLRTEAQLCTL